MNPLESIEKWFAAWNAHDGGAAGALISEAGTYEDPTTGISVRSFDMATVVEAALKPFPDAKFEIISRTGDDKRLCVGWIWHGTNSVSFVPGVEPTGKTLHLRGVDVFEIAERTFTKVTRHFDRRMMAEQLGLQVLVEPRVQGRAVFGYSMSSQPRLDALHSLRPAERCNARRRSVREVRRRTPAASVLLGRPTALHLEQVTLLWIKMGRVLGKGANFVWAMLER